METKLNLNDQTINKIQELIQINIDSEKVLHEASEKVNDTRIRSTFDRLAQQRHHNVEELKTYVSVNHTTPETSGTFMGDARKMWVKARGAISGGEPHSILVEAERAEDVIKGAYEQVLREIPANALNDVLVSQLAKIKQGHDLVRDLRDLGKN